MRTITVVVVAIVLALSLSASSVVAQNLNILWDKTYSDSILGKGFAYSALPVNDGFLIAGERTSPVSPASGLLIKIDSSGNLIWRKVYTGIQYMFLNQFDDSSFIVAGTIDPKSEYDLTPDLFAGLLDFNGNIRWLHRFTYLEFAHLIAQRNGNICVAGRQKEDTSDLMIVQLSQNGDSISTHHFPLIFYPYYGNIPFVQPDGMIVITGTIGVGQPIGKESTNFPLDPVVAIIDLESNTILTKQLKLDWTNEKVLGYRTGNEKFDLLIARHYWSDNDSIQRGPDTTGLAVFQFDYSGNYSITTTTQSPLLQTTMWGASALSNGRWIAYGDWYARYDYRLIYMDNHGNTQMYKEGTPFANCYITNIDVYDSNCFIVIGKDSKGGLPYAINTCIEQQITTVENQEIRINRPILSSFLNSIRINFPETLSTEPTVAVYDILGIKQVPIIDEIHKKGVVFSLDNRPHGLYYCTVYYDGIQHVYPFVH